MLGPGSPHGDSHQFLSSATLLNNLAVTFPPSPFIFLVNFYPLLAVSKGDKFSALWDGEVELGRGSPGAHPSLPNLFCPLLPSVWERGRGSGCRGWGREGRRSRSPGLPSGSGAWVPRVGWILSWGRGSRQNRSRGPRVGSKIGRVPTVL